MSGSEQIATQLPTAPAPSPAALYVAPDFTSWECDRPDAFARDVTIHGIAYRALDPEYYAWLRFRMTLAKEAHVAGKMREATFQELREAFNAVHAWAMDRFAERDLLRAIDRIRPKHYDLPRVFNGGKGGAPSQSTGPFTQVVSPEAIAQVDAIRDKPLSLGWSREALYANTGRLRFPYGQDYGLVCFLGAGTRVGEVTAGWIEIYHGARKQPLRFYRHK